MIVVTFSAFDFILKFTGSSDVVGADLAFMRVLRMLNMIRLLRVVRLMRFFRPMRIIVHSIVNTLKSLTWTVLLLFVILYLFSVLFTQASSHYFINDYCQEINLVQRTRSNTRLCTVILDPSRSPCATRCISSTLAVAGSYFGGGRCGVITGVMVFFSRRIHRVKMSLLYRSSVINKIAEA